MIVPPPLKKIVHVDVLNCIYHFEDGSKMNAMEHYIYERDRDFALMVAREKGCKDLMSGKYGQIDICILI